MTSHSLLLPLLAGFCLLSPSLQDSKPASPAAADELVRGEMDTTMLQEMSWLSGTWVQQSGGKTIEEHWRPLQGTTILGSSHTYDAAKSHFFEYLRIGLRNGTISYVAMPGGAPPTAFQLVQLEDGLMVFENEQHDHPQRIRYERTKDGMTATISQLDGTRAQSFVFVEKD